MALDHDPHAGRDEPQLLDRIDALRVPRADSPEEKGRLLEEIGGPGEVEQDIVSEQSKVKPLWLPDEFSEAHRIAMRSLEVLDRNCVRSAPMPRAQQGSHAQHGQHGQHGQHEHRQRAQLERFG